MSQPTKITLRDNDRNILQLNRKNMPDNIVYSQQLSGYASNTELVDYVKTQTLSNYVQTSELSGYAKTQTLSNYVQTSELSGYAKKEDIAEKPLITIPNMQNQQCQGNVDLDFSASDKYQLIITGNTTITTSHIQQFGQFLLARIDNNIGATISFNGSQIITESGVYIVVFGYNNSMIGNPALQQ